ncbi:hypothetical protein GCM10010448_36090 [Streptomyces glomeratus]|uniref:Uncharacterized protein n=1 Tax=Streptomyces glomeratus TaxID=284452 RepID=A0ABP6LL12_9ACTN
MSWGFFVCSPDGHGHAGRTSGDPAIAPNKDPEHAYIWQRLSDHGVSFRNYGFYASADKSGKAVVEDPVLNAGTGHAFGP